MKKILPVSYPFTATHSHVANPVALLSTDKSVYGWLLNCFIQLRGDIRKDIEYEDFWILDCPVLQCQRVGLDLVRDEWKREIDFVKFALDHEYYVYAMVNTYPIKSYGGYEYMHDTFIYGYDDVKKIFYIADFFQGRKYDFSTAAFDEMDAAFQCRDKLKNGNWVFYDDIILLKPRHDPKAVFEPARVRSSLEAYLKGRPLIDTFQRTRNYTPMKEKDNLFGMNCYQILHRHINYIEETGDILDERPYGLHIMYEHKKIMTERLQYMKQKEYIANADKYINIYADLAQKILIGRNLYIKYSITKDREIMKKISKIVSDAEMVEADVLPEMIGDISSREIAFDIPPIYY